MRVLIFSAFDPIPSDGTEPIRYAHLAEQLLEQGHEVMYITSSFLHVRKTQRKTIWRERGNPPGLQLLLIPQPAYRRHTGIRRLYAYTVLARRLEKRLSAIPESELPDVVLAASPPLETATVLGRWAQRKGIPFVLDVQDVWPYSFAQFIPSWLAPVVLSPLKRRASRNVRLADAIASVSKDMFSYFQLEIGGKDTRVFPLGIDTGSFPAPVDEPNAIRRTVYVGAGQHNPLLLDMVNTFGTLPSWELYLVGIGDMATSMQQHISQKGFKNIVIHPWMEFKALAEWLPGCDLGLLLVNPENHIAFPNKAFAYWAAGLPVISNVHGGELEQLIEKNRLGCTLPEDNHTSLAQAVYFCKEHYQQPDRLRIQAFARVHFNSALIYRQYAGWLLGIAKEYQHKKRR